MNVSKQFFATLRDSVLDRLLPIPHDIFYGTSSKTTNVNQAVAPKKVLNLKFVREKFQLRQKKQRPASDESPDNVAVDDVEQVDTLPIKKRKYVTRSQTHVAVDVTVVQTVQVEKRRKRKTPLKHADFDTTGKNESVNIEKGKKRMTPVKSAEVVEHAKTEKEKKRMFLISQEIGTPVKNDLQTEKVKKRRTPVKSADVTIAEVEQNTDVDRQEGRKRNAPLKSAALVENGVGHNAQAEKVEKKKYATRSRAHVSVESTDVEKNMQVEKGEKRKSPVKSAAVDTTVENDGQHAEAKKGKLKMSPPKSGAVVENAEAEKEGRKKRTPKSAGVVENTEAEKEGRKKRSPLKSAEVVENAEAEKEGKKMTPQKSTAVTENAETEKGKMKRTPLKSAALDPSLQNDVGHNVEVKISEKMDHPDEHLPPKKRGRRKKENATPAKEELLHQGTDNKNLRRRTCRVVYRAIGTYRKMKPKMSGPVKDTKTSNTTEMKNEDTDLEKRENIPTPSQKMPNVPATFDEPNKNIPGVVRKLSWDAKKSLKGYKTKRGRTTKFVASTAPKMLRKEKPVKKLLGFSEKTESKKEDTDELEENAEPENNDLETSKVESTAVCNIKEDHSEEAFENIQNLPECSVTVIDCCNTTSASGLVEAEFLSIPEDVDLNDEEHALIYFQESHSRAGYQLRKLRAKDPLRQSKKRFKKLSPKVKPEPLVLYEMEVPGEVDTLSSEEIVIPDAIPYEFETQAASSDTMENQEGTSASKMSVKPANKKRKPQGEIYNLRNRYKAMQIAEIKRNKKFLSMFQGSDYDILNTKVVLTKKPGQDYWS